MPPSPDTITIRRPDDWHVHFRDSAMLQTVLPWTARQFARAIVMPNLVPPVSDIAADTAHLYLWCPNALLPEGLAVMKAWGFNYKSNVVWHKIRKDGGSDGRGVGAAGSVRPST